MRWSTWAESREVAREQAIRSGASYADAAMARYRAWIDAGAAGFDPLEARDAAHECRHGRLPPHRTPGRRGPPTPACRTTAPRSAGAGRTIRPAPRRFQRRIRQWK